MCAMVWSMRGRPAVAAIDPSTRYRVAHSQAMARCAHKPLLWVVEELTAIDCVGGLSGPLHRVEYFLCLVVRLLQIAPAPALVLAMLEQDVHKYLRVAALVAIRLIGSPAMMRAALRVGWSDYRKICVFGNEDDTQSVMLQGEAQAGSSASLGGKRRRLTAQEVAEQEESALEQLQKAVPPHYFIWRLDELVDHLYNVPLKDEEGAGMTDTPWGAHTFLGIPLPAIVW